MRATERAEGKRTARAAASGQAEGYFASCTVRLPSAEPETVLTTQTNGVRGFWQSGPSWIAHAGATSEIDSREAAAARTAPDDLIDWVRRRAERLFGQRWVLDHDGEARRPRLHGGFSFDGRSVVDGGSGFWEALPAARFVLPAVEVEVDDHGAALTVTRRFPPDMPDREAIDELRRRAVRFRRQLAEREGRVAAPAPMPEATAFGELVSADRWGRSVQRILSAIGNGAVRKVVLARPLDVTLAGRPDPARVLAALRTANPSAHVFAIQFAHDRFFLGAAPELIGSLRGEVLRTMAVAGSAPRGTDPESDAQLGSELRSSEKNRSEHKIVVDDIVDRLKAVGADVADVPEPALLRLDKIQHLKSELEVRVPAGTHILSLLAALHPTAAVCGEPRTTALQILTAEEPVGRGWYAGPIGWFDASGDGEFAPALRSAVCHGPLLRLYAGAGIVEGSRPRAEWDETRVKLQTMLGALGIARAP